MISAILPVYHNEVTLLQNLKYLSKIKYIKERISVFDGYQRPAMFNNDAYNMYTGNIAISNYPDVQWGNSRARNIGAINSSQEWLLFLDVDHTIKEIKRDQLDALHLNAVNRMRRDYEGQVRFPSGSLIIHRDLFFRIGGYDERFCGNYGFEDIHLIWKARKEHNTDIDLYVLPEGRVNLKRDTAVNRKLFEQIRNNGFYS